MRAIFGLVGILVTVGVIVWWMGSGGGLSQTQATLHAGGKAREEVSQIGGMDTQTGERADKSADLDVITSGGKLSGILVTSVDPGGAYARYFGLKPNDTIIAIEYQGNRQNMRDFNGDSDMAKIQVMESYSKHGTLVVLRSDANGNSSEITLPEDPKKAAAAAKPVAAQQGKGNGGGSHDEMQQQLDTIQQIPGAR
jgi:hypothetical protein